MSGQRLKPDNFKFLAANSFMKILKLKIEATSAAS